MKRIWQDGGGEEHMSPTRHSTHIETVLLVEDNDAHAELIAYALSDSGVANRVVRLKNGEECLDYLYHRPPYQDVAAAPLPDVILLDLRIPRLDGFDVLSKIKSDAKLNTVPVVVLTTSDDEKDRVKAYALHANSYLVKPVDARQFSQLLNAFALYWLRCNRNAGGNSQNSNSRAM